MKDESPRIFRALETNAGRDGFDTIVEAAVASYGALRQPGANQARDFARLVVPLWDKISQDTRRSLAASLSHSPLVPRAVVELLLAEPLEISAPFLTKSPALAPADLTALRASNDRRLKKIIEARDTTAAAPTGTDVPQTHAEAEETAPAAFREPSMPPAASPPAAEPAEPLAPPVRPAAEERPAPVAPDTAERIRQTIRRLASPGRTGEPGEVVAELVDLAVQQDAARFYVALELALGLSADMLHRIEQDAGGESLAVALRALNAKPADAMTILMMLKPVIGLDVSRFSLMTRFYRALKPEDCAALAGNAARRAPTRSPSLVPQFQDLEPLTRAVPQGFGRRVRRPDLRDKDSGTG